MENEKRLWLVNTSTEPGKDFFSPGWHLLLSAEHSISHCSRKILRRWRNKPGFEDIKLAMLSLGLRGKIPKRMTFPEEVGYDTKD